MNRIAYPIFGEERVFDLRKNMIRMFAGIPAVWKQATGCSPAAIPMFSQPERNYPDSTIANKS
jgi:hypothetical protein